MDYPENPTQEFYPQMLQVGSVLIIDHNITRYHTYDLFKVMLLDKQHFVRILKKRPEVEEFIRMKNDTMAKLRWAYTSFTPSFMQDVFGDQNNYKKLFNQYLSNEHIQCTPTVMTAGIDTIFENRNICGAYLRQKGDKRPSFDNGDFKSPRHFAMYLTPDIFDVESLINFVNANSFNAVMVDSIQVAATMAYQTKGVTYIIGTYRWNFDEAGEFMGKEHLNLTELSNKNEFGVFYPYNFKAPVNSENKEETENGSDPSDSV